MDIKHDLHLNKLIARKHNGSIKVITGIRRGGKLYLSNNIFYEYLLSEGVKDDRIFKFAFDSTKDLKLINENVVNISTNKNKVDLIKFINYIDTKLVDSDMYYLLLDKVQFLDNFEAFLILI